VYKVMCKRKCYHGGKLYHAGVVYEMPKATYEAAPEGNFDLLEKPKASAKASA